MNLVKLKLLNEVEQLFSPIGLRFAEDPDHGPIVLVPEAQGVKGYRLGMTLEEADSAFKLQGNEATIVAELQRVANSNRALLEEIEALERHLGLPEEWMLEDPPRSGDHNEIVGALPTLRRTVRHLTEAAAERSVKDMENWRSLQIHLGLVDGWQHLHEGAASVKGCLVALREEIESTRGELAELKTYAHGISAEIRQFRKPLSKRIEQIGRAAEACLISVERRVKSVENDQEMLEKRQDQLENDSCFFDLAERVGALEHFKKEGAVKTLLSHDRRIRHLESKQDFDLPASAETPKAASWSKGPGTWRPLYFASPDLRSIIVRRQGAVHTVIANWSPGSLVWRFEKGLLKDPVPNDYEFLVPSETEKKSAWRPLSEAGKIAMPVLVRSTRQPQIVRTADRVWPHDPWRITPEGGQVIAEQYEFCPIPE